MKNLLLISLLFAPIAFGEDTSGLQLAAVLQQRDQLMKVAFDAQVQVAVISKQRDDALARVAELEKQLAELQKPKPTPSPVAQKKG